MTFASRRRLNSFTSVPDEIKTWATQTLGRTIARKSWARSRWRYLSERDAFASTSMKWLRVTWPTGLSM